MVTLAEVLRKAELHKNDLDLELQILEQAAELVIEEEEQIKKGKQKEECEEENESSSSSSSSDEEGEYSNSSSEEEEVCDKSVEEELKGANHGPTVICPCSQEIEHGTNLIQELGKRLEEELRIREDVPQITLPFSSTLREGEAEELRKTDESQLPGALDEVKITDAASDTTQFEHRQLNVHILHTEQLDSDDEDEPNQ